MKLRRSFASSLSRGYLLGLVFLFFGTIGAAVGAPAPEAAEGGLPGWDQESRVWTSTSGSRFVGRIKEVDGDRIVLFNQRGREVTLRRAQLSPADRDHLALLERERHAALIRYYQAGNFPTDSLPPQVDIRGLRHVSQRENFCVPASAEMVLRFHGLDFDQDYIARVSSRDSARSAGTDFAALARAMRNFGLDTVILSAPPSRRDTAGRRNLLDGIRTALADGRPVIISYENLQSGHAVVAIGYDDRRRRFWVLDPALGKRSEPLDYRILEPLVTGALIAFPRPQPAPGGVTGLDPEIRADFLQTVSRAVRITRPDSLQTLADRLGENGIESQVRDANRFDLRASQGQTRSFARREGLEFVRIALDRGLLLAAPQNFDEGPGMILLYGFNGNNLRAVEYRPDGTVRRTEVRPLDFSLRWVWRDDRSYRLPLVEIEPSAVRRS